MLDEYINLLRIYILYCTYRYGGVRKYVPMGGEGSTMGGVGTSGGEGSTMGGVGITTGGDATTPGYGGK